MRGTATTLPVRGIAQNCLILNFVTAVAVAMAMPTVGPLRTAAMASTYNPSPCSASQLCALVRLRTRH